MAPLLRQVILCRPSFERASFSQQSAIAAHFFFRQRQDGHFYPQPVSARVAEITA